jgi:hypothetical protein
MINGKGHFESLPNPNCTRLGGRREQTMILDGIAEHVNKPLGSLNEELIWK